MRSSPEAVPNHGPSPEDLSSHIGVEDGDEVRYIQLHVIPRRAQHSDAEFEARLEEIEEEERAGTPRPRLRGKLSALLQRAENPPAPAGNAAEESERESSPLEAARNNLAEMERRAAAAYLKLAKAQTKWGIFERKKAVREFEEAMARHRFTVQDREWLAGEGELARQAMERRDNFIADLKRFGLDRWEALTCYAENIARLEYEAEKSKRKREIATSELVLTDFERKFGKPRSKWGPEQVIESMESMKRATAREVLEFVLEERELLNEARFGRLPSLKDLIAKALPIFLKNFQTPPAEVAAAENDGAEEEGEEHETVSFEEFRDEFLDACGFKDASSFDVIGRTKVSTLVGQTARTTAAYPPEWRRLIDRLQNMDADGRLTVNEVIEKEYGGKEERSPEIEEPAAPEDAEPAPETPDPRETPIRPGYTETLITPQGLSRALERQLGGHLGSYFTELPGRTQAEVIGYLAAAISYGRGLTLDLAHLVPGEKVNFAPLFEDEELIEEAFAFPREVEILTRLHFSPQEVVNEGYIGVIRRMPVDKYLEAFERATQKGLYAEYGLKKTLEHDGLSTTFYVDEGHIELAQLIKKHGLTPEQKSMSVAEFLEDVDPDEISS